MLFSLSRLYYKQLHNNLPRWMKIMIKPLWYICVTYEHWFFPFVVVTIPSYFVLLWHIIRFVSRVSGQVSLVYYKQLHNNLPRWMKIMIKRNEPKVAIIISVCVMSVKYHCHYRHNSVILCSFMTYNQICIKSIRTGVTSGGGNAYPFGTPGIISVALWSCCCSIIIFLCIALWVILYLFLLFYFNHKRTKYDGIVTTTNGKYQCSYVTQIYHNG
jgi:hypothetical protein